MTTPATPPAAEDSATVSGIEHLASLCNRWVALFDDADQRLDRRIDWTQRAVRHLSWAVIVLACVCTVLAVAVIVEAS